MYRKTEVLAVHGANIMEISKINEIISEVNRDIPEIVDFICFKSTSDDKHIKLRLLFVDGSIAHFYSHYEGKDIDDYTPVSIESIVDTDDFKYDLMYYIRYYEHCGEFIVGDRVSNNDYNWDEDGTIKSIVDGRITVVYDRYPDVEVYYEAEGSYIGQSADTYTCFKEQNLTLTMPEFEERILVGNYDTEEDLVERTFLGFYDDNPRWEVYCRAEGNDVRCGDSDVSKWDFYRKKRNFPEKSTLKLER